MSSKLFTPIAHSYRKRST